MRFSAPKFPRKRIMALRAGSGSPERGGAGRRAGPLLECPGCEPRSTGKRGFAWRGTASVASIRIWLRDLPNDLRDTR
jgi:hypothetical protein